MLRDDWEVLGNLTHIPSSLCKWSIGETSNYRQTSVWRFEDLATSSRTTGRRDKTLIINSSSSKVEWDVSWIIWKMSLNVSILFRAFWSRPSLSSNMEFGMKSGKDNSDSSFNQVEVNVVIYSIRSLRGSGSQAKSASKLGRFTISKFRGKSVLSSEMRTDFKEKGNGSEKWSSL